MALCLKSQDSICTDAACGYMTTHQLPVEIEASGASKHVKEVCMSVHMESSPYAIVISVLHMLRAEGDGMVCFIIAMIILYSGLRSILADL